jgi:hypothetical protein
MDVSSNLFPLSDVSLPTEPATISLADILNSAQVVTQKEASDKALLESIGTASLNEITNKLIVWATTGFPNAYPLFNISITPPAVCSDGVTRDLTAYIQFCSGKTINEHVQVLQDRMTDIIVSFANMGNAIAIVVSKLQD